MKKITGIIAIILFLAPNVIHADKIFDIKWSLVNFGYGVNSYQAHEDNHGGNWELYFALGTIGFEHINTKIGLEFNSARWWAGYNYFSSDRNGWNFFNLNLYWNIIDYRIFHFGPFNRINYMYLTNKGLDWSKFTNTLGIRLEIISEIFDYYNMRYIGIECGFRNKDGRTAFYLGLDIDAIIIFLALEGLADS